MITNNDNLNFLKLIIAHKFHSLQNKIQIFEIGMMAIYYIC